MSDFKITCQRCDSPVQHECNADLKEAVERLLSWVPTPCWSSDRMQKAFEDESAEQGDEFDFSKQPFFGSQAWSYLIWYKEDARTFHALIHNLIRATGMDPHEIMQKLHKEEEE